MFQTPKAIFIQLSLAMFKYICLLVLSLCGFYCSGSVPKKPYMWVVVATFKNESSIISDWLQHYLHEGADHFYLIDNGSMDDYLKEVQRFPQEMITIIRDSSSPRMGLQDALMKKYIAQNIINDAHWVLVVDIDEYVYPLALSSCIVDVLVAQSETVSRIWLPWKVFGSNGHLVQPQEGIVSGFTKRKAVEYTVTPSVLGYGKSFTRVKDKLHMSTHSCGNGDPAMFYSNGSQMLYGNEHSKIILREEETRLQPLQLNHYMFQSRDYYQKIKCSRGGGQSGRVSKYTMEFFDKHEPHANAIEDTGLLERYDAKNRTRNCMSKFAHALENLHE